MRHEPQDIFIELEVDRLAAYVSYFLRWIFDEDGNWTVPGRSSANTGDLAGTGIEVAGLVGPEGAHLSPFSALRASAEQV